MSVKDSLTNEMVNKRFDNPFALVNYSIEMALKMMSKGDIGTSHLASEILELIADGQDAAEMAALDYEEPKEEEEDNRRYRNSKRSDKHHERNEKSA